VLQVGGAKAKLQGSDGLRQDALQGCAESRTLAAAQRGIAEGYTLPQDYCSAARFGPPTYRKREQVKKTVGYTRWRARPALTRALSVSRSRLCLAQASGQLLRQLEREAAAGRRAVLALKGAESLLAATPPAPARVLPPPRPTGLWAPGGAPMLNGGGFAAA